MKYIQLTLLFSLLSFPLFSQNYNYDKAWEEVENLQGKGLSSQALEKSDQIFQYAKNEGNSLQKVKSLIYKSNSRSAFEEEALLSSIEEIKEELQFTKGVEKAMLLTALSDLYLQYYQQNQWTIRQRNDIAGEQPKNIMEWSHTSFTLQIEKLLNEALSYKNELQVISSESWKAVFQSEEESYNYQPFLYDFVAWKALAFYSSREFINQAAEDLVLLNDSDLFQDYHGFSNLDLSSKLKLTYKEQSLLLFQELISLHSGRKEPSPLLFEEVQRLKYLRKNSSIDDKEQLIVETLKQLINNYKGQNTVDIPTQMLVALYMEEKTEENLQNAQVLCKQMIDQDINSKYYRNILDLIEQAKLSIEIQETQIPQQAFLAQVRFKNLDNVWYKIIRLANDENKYNRGNQEVDYEKYIAYQSIAQGQWKLLNNAQLNSKTAEVSLPPLDLGHYAIILSSSPEFDTNKDVLSLGVFWVSRLQLIKQDGSRFLLVDRESGKAVEGANIQAYSWKWEYSSRKNLEKLEQEMSSDNQGFFSLNDIKNSRRISLIVRKGNDEWRSSNIYLNNRNKTSKSREKHYFFTDRAIYRPGQTVYFKGILTKQEDNKVTILPQQETTVSFYSTQGKMIESLSLTSNEFGSISGSFICPLAGLNGRLRISDKKGSIAVLMEEYKRPKFEVVLQQPEEEYVLNEEVTIKGEASYYAGVGLQNASVKYKVVRATYMPWRWTCIPNIQRDMTITAGKTSTDENGVFQISFQAIAPKISKGIQWYNYKIIADISDETGETHQQILNLNLGDRSLFITTNLPEIMDKENPQQVKITAETPNGKTLDKTIHFKLEKLVTPNEIAQENSWKSDTIIISKKILDKDFPYQQNAQGIEDYKVEAIVLEKTMNTANDSVVPKSIFASLSSGVYKMTLSSKDKNNNKVEEIEYVRIYSSLSKKMPWVQDAFFNSDRITAEVGDDLQISFGSSFKNLHYYYQLYQGENLITSSWEKLSNSVKQFQIPIIEDYRGGLSLQIIFVRNNKFYNFQQNISVPYKNKELDMQLVTMRNPMQAGAKEKWTLWIKNQKGEAVAAEVLAGMYDASLDVFAKHQWNLWPYSSSTSSPQWKNVQNGFYSFNNTKALYLPYQQSYTPLSYTWSYNLHPVAPMRSMMAKGADTDNLSFSEADISGFASGLEVVDEKEELQTEEKSEETMLSPRKNLEETAFFFPHLLTDKEGYVQLEFTSPEALSRWKLMVLATTKNMELASLTQDFVTQKEVMVMPNLPRFLRGGDRISLSSKIINMLDKEQKITAELEILDAKTMQPLYLQAIGTPFEKHLNLSAKEQATVHWKIQVPQKVGAVVIRILAKGQDHSDGEEHILPVLSQMQFITDTYPFYLNADKNYNTQDVGIRQKEWKEDDELTLEITTNPIWYVVQALPNYSIPQNPAALNWFSYYFVYAMAQDIVKRNPEIEQVFKQWQQQYPEELISELEQNQELKQILLQETPWVQNAQDQSKHKAAIARLFQENQLNYQLQNALKHLKNLQKYNGGWAWYDGMHESTYITSSIINGMGQLKQKAILDFRANNSIKNISKKAIKYLDDEMLHFYQKELSKDKKRTYSAQHILQARAWFLHEFPLNSESQKAFDYYLNKWNSKWAKMSIKEQAHLVQVLWLSDDKQQAQAILASIKDKMLTDKYGGLYWRDLSQHASVENQAFMIELMELTEADKSIIQGLKLWLLQQKRANDWGNSQATAQACFAMLSDKRALNDKGDISLNINGEEIEIDASAGSGYFKMTWKGNEIANVVSHLEINKKGDALAFGALYHQYFEKMSKIEAHSGGVEIEKRIFLSVSDSQKQEWKPLQEGAQIPLGSKVLVRLVLNNEQAMDFVHLRDYLPAGFEPLKPLSAYRWKGGLAYYQSPGDVATDYFIAHLPKGEFVLEYELFATSAGVLNWGPAQIQSLYAPEFGGHSKGGEIVVAKE